MEIVFILILIASVILHEISHGYVAYSLGDPTAKHAGRLTVNPIKHIDPVGSVLIPFLLILTNSSILFGWAKPVPYNPYNLKGRFGEFFVAAAGVAVNLSLAIIFGLGVRFFGDVLSPSAIELMAIIVIINLFLGILNLLPLPPLDGYRMFQSIAPFTFIKRVQEKVDSIRSSIGQIGLFILIFVCVYFLIGPLAILVTSVYTALTGDTSLSNL